MKAQRIAPTMLQSWFLGALLALSSGCLSPGPTPGPTPGPGPQPVTDLSQAVTASLANAERADCLKMYGVFTALANYVEGGGKGVTSTSQLLQLTTVVMDNVRWQKGKYPAFSQVVTNGLNAKFRQPQPIDGVRQQVVATFREIALGCRGAVR